jgi:biopolymer transport protein TolR
MRRLKPKKTKKIKIFRLDFIALSIILFVFLILGLLFKPAMFGIIELELPRGTAEVIILDQEPITISIKRNEEIYLNDRNIKLAYLPNSILELSDDKLDVKIFVKADKELSFDKIVKVISFVNSEGFNNISLVIDISKDL